MITKNYTYIRRGRILAVLCFLLLNIYSLPITLAQSILGPRSLAVGGALRATPNAEDAVLINPAGMSLFRSYQLSGTYQYRASDSGSLVNVSVVDSITSKLAAGLFYSFIHSTPSYTLALGPEESFALQETWTTHETGLALSYPIINSFHLGFTVKYVNHSVDQPEGTPPAAQAEDITGFTLDLGGILQVTSSLNLALTGQNLIAKNPYLYPRLMGMGISYAFENILLVEFDTVLNFSSAESVKPRYHTGLELFLAKTYALRGGAQYDALLQGTYITAGLGLISTKAGLDLSFRQMVSGGAETIFAFGLRFLLI